MAHAAERQATRCYRAAFRLERKGIAHAPAARLAAHSHARARAPDSARGSRAAAAHPAPARPVEGRASLELWNDGAGYPGACDQRTSSVMVLGGLRFKAVLSSSSLMACANSMFFVSSSRYRCCPPK